MADANGGFGETSLPLMVVRAQWKVGRSRLGIDDDVVVALGLAAAEEGVAFVRFAGVAHGILHFAGFNLLLARSAVAHAATIIKIEVIGFGQLENALVVASPVEFQFGFLKNDFRHVLSKASLAPIARNLALLGTTLPNTLRLRCPNCDTGV